MSETPHSEPKLNSKGIPLAENPQWHTGSSLRKKSDDRNMSSIHNILNDEDPLYRRRSSSVATHASIEEAPTPPPLPSAVPPSLDTSEPNPKRGRGRPRKHNKEVKPNLPKRPRGRPRKTDSYDAGHRAMCENYIALSNSIVDRLSDGRTPHSVWMIANSRSLVQTYLAANTENGALTDIQAGELELIARGGQVKD